MKQITRFCKEHRVFMLASFFIPFLVMALIYLTLGIYPGSSRSVLASDAFSQFSNFHASFRNVLLGKQSLFYTWHASLGLNYLALVSYYLGGFFTPLVLFFPNHLMPDALYFLTLLKIGSAGLAFWFYAKHTFKINRWAHVTLATCYALMSFITAYSELIMWLDAFVYLPLIIWGIHRLIDLHRPTLLFISYFMLFFSNFYMGFMIGIFSALYFLVRLFSNWKHYKKSILPYGVTSLLAGGASMIIILPAIIDLRTNGEELSHITTWKTEATNYWDFFTKNMIGVYDTTKYGSTPFIYIGLLPLALCLVYFLSKKIKLKEKLLFLSLFALFIASFYLVPLNLFWHGMHAPNMFLFRYAYLVSFLIIMLAGYGWEHLTKPYNTLLISLVTWVGIFILTYITLPKGTYEYISWLSFLLTLGFLIIYGFLFIAYQKHWLTKKRFAFFLLLFVTLEMGVNTNGTLRGILGDWNYASRSLYTKPYPDINQLVEQTNSQNDTFYRLENLDPVSANDSINYGYSGVSMFSSIRNRHSSSYLDQLGFRSRGTNLNIRYQNNTLLMDGFLGIKYNIAKQPINKYGFESTSQSDQYLLYENQNALPLGFLADLDAAALKSFPNDNLGSQTELFNTLANLNERYYQFEPLTVVDTDNTRLSTVGNHTTFTEKEGNKAKVITWEVTVPAHSQAYLSLYPTNFNALKSSTVTIAVNGEQRKTPLSINGQYYDLGYFEHTTTFQFSASFYGTASISFQTPKVLRLDTNAYQKAVNQLQKNGVDFNVDKRSAQATVTTTKEQLLVTTIPYDKGWSATIDGQKVPISAFKNAFLSIKIPQGSHTITFHYLPQGFTIGAILCVICIASFLFFRSFYLKKHVQ